MWDPWFILIALIVLIIVLIDMIVYQRTSKSDIPIPIYDIGKNGQYHHM